MPGVILFAEISRPRGMAGAFNKALKATLQAAGNYWHRELLPAHFGPANRARFGHAPRTRVYSESIKKREGRGQGRFVDNVLKGKSRRFMQAFATVTGTAKQATVTLKPPAYFANPYVGPLPGGRRITQQPDKTVEITAVDQRDAEKVSEFAAKTLTLLIEQGFLQSVRATRIRG